MNVRPRKRADRGNLRAALDDVPFARNGRDVREVVEGARRSAHDDDAGTVASPARDGVRVGNAGDDGSILRSVHRRSDWRA